MCGGSGHKKMLQDKLGMEAGRQMFNAGQLSPDWTEWLMGWPIGLTASRPLATDRSPYAPRWRFQSWLNGMRSELARLAND